MEPFCGPYNGPEIVKREWDGLTGGKNERVKNVMALLLFVVEVYIVNGNLCVDRRRVKGTRSFLREHL